MFTRCLVLVAALAGCEDRLPSIPPPDPHHDLVIEQGLVKYNGQLIGPGVKLEDAIRVLGPGHRRDVSVLYWDALGLSVGGDAKVDCVSAYIDVRPWMFTQNGVSGPIGLLLPTSKSFPGRVLLEGAPVFKGSTVEQLNRQIKLDCRSSKGNGLVNGESFAFGDPPTYECQPHGLRRTYEVKQFKDDLDTNWILPGPFVPYVALVTVCCRYDQPCP